MIATTANITNAILLSSRVSPLAGHKGFDLKASFDQWPTREGMTVFPLAPVIKLTLSAAETAEEQPEVSIEAAPLRELSGLSCSSWQWGKDSDGVKKHCEKTDAPHATTRR